MTTERFGAQVRAALGTLGDAALPPRSFDELTDGSMGRAVPPSVRRGAMVGALLAVAAAVVAVLVRSGGTDPVVSGSERSLADAGRWYAVPLHLPDGMALRESGTNDFTGAFDAEPGPVATDAVLAYSSGSANVVVTSGRARPLRPVDGARPIDLRGGIVGDVKIDSDTQTRLRWVQPDGPIVLLVSNGIDLDELLSIASSMWFVTDDMFAELTEHAGFISPDQEARGFDAWRPPGVSDDGIDIHVSGSLQTGFGVGLGRTGQGLDGRPIDECRALSIDRKLFFLVGPVGTSSFAVSAVDGPSVLVPAGTPPGLPGRAIATWRSDAFEESGWPVVKCEGSGS